MADLVDAVRVRKPNEPVELQDLYFPAKQEVTGPNGGRVPVDIGTSGTVNISGDVIAEFDGVEEALGAPADAAAGSDTATTGLIGLMKRLLGKLPSSFQQGSGAVTASTTRVTLASDGPGVTALTSIDNKTAALVAGRVPVDGSGITQPISANALPLPTGAATADNQSTANSSLSSIDGKLPTLSNGRLPVDVGAISLGDVEVKNDAGSPIPASVSSLPLPTGAATAANQDTANTSLSSIDGKLPALSSGAVPVAPAVQLGSGVMTATTQRITLATDGPTVSTLTSIDTKTPSLVNGRQPVESFTPALTPSTTSVASSASSVTILATNANRRGVSIFNDSTATLRLSFSTPATTANAFIGLPAGAFLLLDQQLIITGAIYGIWSAANGTAQVTEFV